MEYCLEVHVGLHVFTAAQALGRYGFLTAVSLFHHTKHNSFQRQLRFIHSFITEIYIVSFQGYYSEALPILAHLKKRVLRPEWRVLRLELF